MVSSAPRAILAESATRNDVLPRRLSVEGATHAAEPFTPATMVIDGSEPFYDALGLQPFRLIAWATDWDARRRD